MREFDDISRALGRPFRGHRLLLVVCFIVAGIAARFAAEAFAREIAIVIGVALLIASVGAYWIWFERSRYAGGFEALLDHELAERRSWLRTFGSRMPRNRAQARRWLAEHPASPSNDPWRVSLLSWTGDLAAARTTLDSLAPETPDERFAAEIQRGTIAYLEGADPDLSAARTALAALTDSRERRHGRVCLAILEGRTALASGGDPWLPILAARAEMGDVDSTVTIRALGIRLAFVVGVAVLAFVGLALLVH